MTTAGWFGLTVICDTCISLVVGLQLPKLQQWLDNRGKTSREKELTRQKDEYEDVIYYALHTDLLVGKMVGVAIRIALYAMVFALITCVRPQLDDLYDVVAGQYHPALSPFGRVVVRVLVGLLITCGFGAYSIMLVWTIRMVTDIHMLYLNVRYFKSFAESVPDAVRDKEREQFVMNARRDRAVPGFYENIEFLRTLAKKSDATDEAHNTTAQTPSDPSAPQT